MSEHMPTINRHPYFSTPYVYWVCCSCGRYARRGKCANDIDAWKAWVAHRNALANIEAAHV